MLQLMENWMQHNMSLGGPVNSALIDAAVISASAVVKFALAAGNGE
jgi:hypothetical protein